MRLGDPERERLAQAAARLAVARREAAALLTLDLEPLLEEFGVDADEFQRQAERKLLDVTCNLLDQHLDQLEKTEGGQTMISILLLIAAIIIFAVAAAGGTVGGIVLVPLGLALFAAAHLPWGDLPSRS